MRICDTDYIKMWIEDKQSIIETMVHNMQADIDAGYNPNGECITRQKNEIELYKLDMDMQMKDFSNMDQAKANRWCYYDMIKRGAIEV